MRIAREEIFGPVLCVIPYGDEESADKPASGRRSSECMPRAGSGRCSQRAKREGRADDPHVEPPEIVLRIIGRLALLFDRLGLFVEVHRRRQAIEEFSFLPQRRLDLGPTHAAKVSVLLVALQAVLFTVIGVFLRQDPQGIGVKETNYRLGAGSHVGHATSPTAARRRAQ